MWQVPSKYLDQSDEIVTTETDLGDRAGDSLQRNGMVGLGAYLNHKFGTITDAEYTQAKIDFFTRITTLEGPLGTYRRGSTGWTNTSLTCSRDQMISNLIAAGLIGDTVTLKRFTKFHVLTRLGCFMTNILPNRIASWTDAKLPDLTLFGFWNILIRANKNTILRPLLYLYDLSLLANSALIVYYKAKDPEFTDELSFQCALIQSREQWPTFVSELAVCIYNKRPSPNPPHNGQTSEYPPQQALDQYFGYAGGMSAPINELYRPVLEKELSK